MKFLYVRLEDGRLVCGWRGVSATQDEIADFRHGEAAAVISASAPAEFVEAVKSLVRQWKGNLSQVSEVIV